MYQAKGGHVDLRLDFQDYFSMPTKSQFYFWRERKSQTLRKFTINLN